MIIVLIYIQVCSVLLDPAIEAVIPAGCGQVHEYQVLIHHLHCRATFVVDDEPRGW